MPRGPMLPSLCVNAQKVHSCCTLFAVFCISCRLEHLLRAGCPHALYPVPAPLCKGLGLKEKDLLLLQCLRFVKCSPEARAVKKFSATGSSRRILGHRS